MHQSRTAPMIARLKSLARTVIMAAAQPFGTTTHVATSEPAVALTFDDGPDPDSTPKLLDLLEAHGARGTFFMVGKAARKHPEIVARVAAGGHAIGNHSWDHSSFPLLKGRWRREQIRWCQEAISPYGQKLFRPPYGEQSLGSQLDALRLGYRIVTWNLLTEDWRGDPPEQVMGRIRGRMAPGSIVLFHDAVYTTANEAWKDRSSTLGSVELLLREYGEAFRFVTVPELLELGNARKSAWYWPAQLENLRNLI